MSKQGLHFAPFDSLKRPDVPDLDRHKAEFAARGGKVQVIPDGISGLVQTTGPRHITLTSAKKRHSKAKIRYEDEP